MMDKIDVLRVYFYIAAVVTGASLVFLFFIITVLFMRINKLIKEQKDWAALLIQRENKVSDFCYSNPAIVPGEELARRGFAMYSGGDDHLNREFLPMSIEKSDSLMSLTKY